MLGVDEIATYGICRVPYMGHPYTCSSFLLLLLLVPSLLVIHLYCSKKLNWLKRMIFILILIIVNFQLALYILYNY